MSLPTLLLLFQLYSLQDSSPIYQDAQAINFESKTISLPQQIAS
jgi:hypothetical protein